ncbi:hypothetical protein LCGC14_0617630 [marine sediment metagenome]|uniref:Uncharacterized protein n=1 Tax=marine sediment metagenome TaxID=412755 RepID=A0A0F9TS41_9ZZZZ
MEITDIILESHIVSEGKLTKEQTDEIEELLENATEVNLEQIAQVLEKGGHKLVKKHAHTLDVSEFNSYIINEENEGYLDIVSELVKNFDKQSTKQPNTQKI